MPDDVEPLSVQNTVHGDVHGDNVQIGYIGGDFTLHQHAKTRPPAELPLQIGVVPQQVASFQFRSVPVGEHVTVFSGMGGVGKTQLVADLAAGFWTRGVVKLLVWVTASSRESVVTAYAEAAAELTGRDDLGPERGARRLLEWLARTDEQWCVVLDDLQDPGDLAGLWPPNSPKGRVLVTTRRRDAALRGEGWQIVPVDTFTANEGLTYLQAVLGGQPSLLHGAAEVVAALGSLPLALAQAGAYMLDRHLSCAEYLTRLRFRKGDADEHQATVAATWALSLEQAETLRPQKVAGLLLDLAAVLSPNGVPLDVLVGPTVRDHLALNARCVLDEAGVRSVLAGLHRLSLITLDSGEVRIHALVQQAHRDTWKTKQWRRTVRAAGDALVEVWPELERSDERGQVLRANAQALMASGGEHLQGRHMHLLPMKLGHSLGLCGLVAEARDHFDRLHATATRDLGRHNYFTLIFLDGRAHWRNRAGDPVGAMADYEQFIAGAAKLGRSDRAQIEGMVMDAHHAHASLRAATGDLTGGIAELERLLAVQERLVGQDHPDALAIRHDLTMYRTQLAPGANHLAELEQLVADQLHAYGPDHPQTLAARHNLAVWRGENGDLPHAHAELQQLVADTTRVLGADHPTTLKARSVLIDCVGHLVSPAQAVAEFEQLLADRHRVLGQEHPDVLSTWERILHWQRAGNQRSF